MRLRNIPGARDRIAQSPWIVQKPEEQKGNWKSLFPHEGPLHLEIGTGKGRFIHEMAVRNPDINYIGIEKYSSVLIRALDKQEETTCPNLLFIRGDAELVNEYFAPEEIDRIYLNFSDPWPKDRHAKRRLPSKEFLRRFAMILKKGGTIEFKTDNRPLFDFAMEEIEQGGFRLLQYTNDLHADPAMSAGNVMTEYEERFSKKGNKINKYIIAALTLALLFTGLSPAAGPFPALQALAAEESTDQSAEGGVDYYAEAEARKEEPVQTNELENWPQGPAIGAESAILMEANTGSVLYAKNIHEELYPASITKIMTGLLAFENLSPSDMVPFSEEAVFGIERDSSNIGIDVGEELTGRECLYAIFVASANEVAMAIAEKAGGSVDGFAEMMNERAAQLGCQNTHFVNPHGLHSDEHYTSAYDMALIAREFFSHDNLAEYANMATYHFEPTDTQPDDFYLRNKHQLINGDMPYDGVLGGKTGFTTLSRQTLVTCCERDDLKLICVIMKEESPNQFQDTIDLFDYGFDNFHRVKVTDFVQDFTLDDPGFMQQGKDIFGSKALPLSIDGGGYVVIPDAMDFSVLTSSFVYDEAQIASGELPQDDSGNLIVGKLQYAYGDNPVGTADLLFTGSLPTEEEKKAMEEEAAAQEAAAEGAPADADAAAADAGEASGTDTASVEVDPDNMQIQLPSDHATVTHQSGIVEGIRAFFENILHSGADGTLFLDVPALLFLVIIVSGVLVVFLTLIAYIRHLHRSRKRRRRRKLRKEAEERVRQELIKEHEHK